MATNTVKIINQYGGSVVTPGGPAGRSTTYGPKGTSTPIISGSGSGSGSVSGDHSYGHGGHEGYGRGWRRGPRYFSSPSYWGPYTSWLTNPTTERIITVKKEVPSASFKIRLNSGDYCGRSGLNRETRNICDSGMICDNDNKCVTYRADLDVPELKNRHFRLCKNEDDTHCIARNML